MTSSDLERLMRLRLDGTFTRAGGARQAVPLDFMPSHEEQISTGRLSEAEAVSILAHYRASRSCTVTAARYGVSLSTVCNIAKGRTWARLQSQPSQGATTNGQ